MVSDSAYVRAVCELRDRMKCAPTTGDVAAMLGVTTQHARRRLRAIPDVFCVPDNPAPRWQVRGGLAGGAARVLALVQEAGNLLRGLEPSDAAALQAQILDALEGRR
jgi:hypothetical protein